MQHGEAKPEQEDPARPLTERGRGDVERVARVAARLGLGIAVVQHSGKLRAEQTAGIVAESLRPSPLLRVMAGLAPNDDPAAAAESIRTATEPWLLVGHLPHLSRLASLLLGVGPQRTVVGFQMGGLVALTGEGPEWRLRWILTPELAEASGLMTAQG